MEKFKCILVTIMSKQRCKILTDLPTWVPDPQTEMQYPKTEVSDPAEFNRSTRQSLKVRPGLAVNKYLGIAGVRFKAGLDVLPATQPAVSKR